MSVLDKIAQFKAGNLPEKKVKAADPLMKRKIKDAIERKPQAPAELVKAASTANHFLVDILPRVQSIQAITSVEQFQTMDKYLGIIDAEIVKWDAQVEKILKPVREAKKAIHDMDHEIGNPRLQLRALVKGLMDEWNRKLLAAKREEERIRDDEARKLQEKANAVARQVQVAATSTAKERLRAQLQQLTKTVEAVKEIQPETTLQQGVNSHARTLWKWKITNMLELVQAVAAGDLPLDILGVDSTAFNKYFKDSRTEVAEWPGIEVYEDVTTAKGQAWREE